MEIIDFQNTVCKHCYKCVRSCAVKAIRIKDEQAQIVNEDCVLCGRCLEVCPQGAKTFNSDLERVKKYLADGEDIIVSIAPAYRGILEYEHPGQVVEALLQLGFSEVRETAEGAVFVTNEYTRIMEDGSMTNIISSCCPCVNDMVERHYPELIPYVAPVVSPMIAHGMMIKAMKDADVKVVFIGPCIAKKEEGIADERTKGYIDAVITFSELQEWLKEEQVDIKCCETKPMANPDPKINQLYPVSGGVIQSVMAKKRDVSSYDKIFVDGVENVMELFESMKNGELEGCFAEVNGCSEGCINGPATLKRRMSKYKAKLHLQEHVEYSAPDYPDKLENISLHKSFSSKANKGKMPSEEEIKEILRSTGKYTKEQELDCSACGYSTCREKAIAVYQQKAENSMCLPYAFEKAQSMSNLVLEMTPNMILIVDNELRIREFNKKAEEIFGISKEEALEKYIFELMDEEPFIKVLDTKEMIENYKYEFKESGITVLQTHVFLPDQNSVLSIFQDITEAEQEKLKTHKIKMDTVELAQNVIDKQMTVAHEIAGLLGETTAETKVILSKLRDTILFEE